MHSRNACDELCEWPCRLCPVQAKRRCCASVCLRKVDRTSNAHAIMPGRSVFGPEPLLCTIHLEATDLVHRGLAYGVPTTHLQTNRRLIRMSTPPARTMLQKLYAHQHEDRGHTRNGCTQSLRSYRCAAARYQKQMCYGSMAKAMHTAN